MSCQAVTNKNQVCKNSTTNKYCHVHKQSHKFPRPDECSVCFESLQNQSRPLRCGHYIHDECMKKWNNNTCPICRAVVKPGKLIEIKLTQQSQEYITNILQVLYGIDIHFQ